MSDPTQPQAPTTNPSFTWATTVSKIDYKLGGITKPVSISFVHREGDADDYIRLDTSSSEIHIKFEDLIARLDDDPTEGRAFKADKKKRWFACSLWSKTGKLLSKNDEVFSKRVSPKILETLSALDDDPKNGSATPGRYALAWEKVLLAAVEYSKKMRPLAGRKIRRRISLLRHTKERSPIGPSCLKASVKADADPNVAAQCTFEVLTVAQVQARNDLVHLSTHPLGFYRTYVTFATLATLVDLQVGQVGGSWFRSMPSLATVGLLNTELLTRGVKFRHKQSLVSATTHTRNFMYHGHTSDGEKRDPTEGIMGDSANKWAKRAVNATVPGPGLGWTGDGTVAEWLHRIAHRFDGSEADIFYNLICGTTECNTHMIRAEGTISRLLLSDKILSVSLLTSTTDVGQIAMLDRNGLQAVVPVPWHNPNVGFDQRYYWVTSHLDYEIQCVGYDNNQDVPPHTTRFYPFHRYSPLTYEFALDKLVLQKWLENLPADYV
ncbi:hypothetical protein Hypma_003874 [Hypsizygus marmoreus]|uniref:Uncharacterized protein n=1 Tax=Hypsizygus marmoreus TaxID=39966 RepID=A0A369K1T8_HYPMA|nr:hypothetical protein Hypma_003874 [Hypsizygus marmoreus]